MNSKSISSLNSWSSSLSSWSEQQNQIIFNPEYHILHSNIPEYGIYNDQNQQHFQIQYQTNFKPELAFQQRRPITGVQKTFYKNKPVPNMALLEPLQNLSLKNSNAKYSRKVFIGGLPPDIAESI